MTLCSRVSLTRLSDWFMCEEREVVPEEPSPLSTYGHFCCSSQHLVRLLTTGGEEEGESVSDQLNLRFCKSQENKKGHQCLQIHIV